MIEFRHCHCYPDEFWPTTGQTAITHTGILKISNGIHFWKGNESPNKIKHVSFHRSFRLHPYRNRNVHILSLSVLPHANFVQEATKIR